MLSMLCSSDGSRAQSDGKSLGLGIRKPDSVTSWICDLEQHTLSGINFLYVQIKLPISKVSFSSDIYDSMKTGTIGFSPQEKTI